MSKTLLRGGRLVDPASGQDGRADVLLDDSLVADVGQGLDAGGAEVVDCDGLVVAPGLVDLHAHLREPGREDAETIETGSRAAAVGGYTAVCAMPNTEPVADHAAVVLEVMARSEKVGLCDILPAGSITRGLEGEELVEIGELAELGIRLFTDDHRCVQSARVMRLALEYAKAFDVVICQHAQEESLTDGWQMHEGHYSSLLGLRGAPSEAEEIVVARDLMLARLTGGRLHITHVSASGSIEAIARARAEGLRVTADVTPHHLLLADEDLTDYDTNRKVNPPLRSVEDRSSLQTGLANAAIDAIATDHAPHPVEDKECEFDQARPGTIGFETALPAVLELVEGTMLPLTRALEAMSTTPARILGLDEHGGPVAPGRMANLVVFDPAEEWVAGDRPFASRSRNSAFLGRSMRGRVRHTIFRGGFTVRDGESTR
ncbi:MAG: dihydroorotase [Actinomycetota bacterium]